MYFGRQRHRQITRQSDRQRQKPDRQTKVCIKAWRVSSSNTLRLGCEMPLRSVISICDCGKDVDGDGYHFLTCKTGGGPIWTHETLLSVWSNCLQQLNMTHQRGPRNRYINTDDRPDIIAFDAQSGCDVELDISVTHPCAKHYFPGSFGRWRSCSKEKP